MVSSLNSSRDSQMPYTQLLLQHVPVSLHTFIHRHKTGAGVFPTGSTEVHKYFAKPFIIQSILNTSLCTGNKFGRY